MGMMVAEREKKCDMASEKGVILWCLWRMFRLRVKHREENMKYRVLFALCALMGMLGCSGNDEAGDFDDVILVPEIPGEPDEPDEPGNSVKLPEFDKNATIHVQMEEPTISLEDVRALTAEEMEGYGDRLNRFAFEMYHRMEMKADTVFSPFSLHAALSMAAYGAAGSTYDEMVQVLGMEAERDKGAQLNGAMSVKMRYDGQQEGSIFRIANRIWVDRSIETTDAFQVAMNDWYKAPLQVVDFVNYATDVRHAVNQWVSNVTQGMIRELLGEGSVTAYTRYLLVNAIYFDGKWAHKFLKENTLVDVAFHVSPSQTVLVNQMHQKSSFPYYDGENYRAVAMDYENNDFSMIVVLPDAMDGLSGVMQTFDAADVRQILSEASPANIDLRMPKFRISNDLSQIVGSLKELGMNQAFTNGADFSNMTSAQIAIDQIIQKAVIEVDEEGTKAAAATGVLAGTTSVGGMIEYIDFNVDHPFAYALVHKASGSILFMGQYSSGK